MAHHQKALNLQAHLTNTATLSVRNVLLTSKIMNAAIAAHAGIQKYKISLTKTIRIMANNPKPRLTLRQECVIPGKREAATRKHAQNIYIIMKAASGDRTPQTYVYIYMPLGRKQGRSQGRKPYPTRSL